jgi:glyoxylase-like metal-dependent hydrolase (beta-lactamase superfamily II)
VNQVLEPDTRRFGRIKVILGPKNGRYPYGNSILIEDDRTALIDPSLLVRELRGRITKRAIDLVFNSHYHEDHGAGNSLYRDAPLYLHGRDAPALRSLDTMIEYYGLQPEAARKFRPLVVDQFHYQAREDIDELSDGEVFDLGHTRVRVMHTPGHTGGHCCFFFEREGVLFVADCDLTRFGPVYGDRTSGLVEFIESIEKIRRAGAKTLVSFHEAAVVENDTQAAIDRYLGVIYQRERTLLDFLAQPRTFNEIVKRRIIFRKDYDLIWIDSVENNSMRLHLDKLMAEGTIEFDGRCYLRRHCARGIF